jgi:hypothetical protein
MSCDCLYLLEMGGLREEWCYERLAQLWARDLVRGCLMVVILRLMGLMRLIFLILYCKLIF